jgi:hypothetical protein
VVARAAAGLGLLAIPVGGCNLNAFTVNSTAPVLKIGSAALDRESDIQYAREASPSSLLTVEAFLVTTPDNKDLLEILAQGYTQYPFAFLEDDLEVLGEDGDPAKRATLIDRCTNFYDRAFARGLHLAELHDPGIVAAIKGGDGAALDKELLKFASNEDGVSLYWMGLALGSAINLHKDDMNRVADLPKAVALLERAHAIAPAYSIHGAAMALGVVFGSQGKAMGGDPDKSRKMFDEVISATGGRYLMAKTLFARTYAASVQDKPLFEKTLREVVDAPADLWPEQRLANELAKRRAARYLAQADDLFLPAEPSAKPATSQR